MNEAQIESLLDKIWNRITITPSLLSHSAELLMEDITEIVYDSWTEQENEVEPDQDEPVPNEARD